MADSMCGPSNPLQNFQKHSQVDRTLQQDRLISRQSPSEGFRSSTPNAGILDSEFEAFQAGLPLEDPSIQTLPFRPLQAPRTLPQPPAFAAGWANDFQSSLNPSRNAFQTQPHQPASFVQQRPAPSWHADFLQSQNTAFSPPQPSFQPMYNFGGGPSAPLYAPQFPQVVHGQQRALEPMIQDPLDMAAFERAFDAAQKEIMETEARSSQNIQELQEETNHLAAQEASRMQNILFESKMPLGQQLDSPRGLAEYQKAVILLSIQNTQRLLEPRPEDLRQLEKELAEVNERLRQLDEVEAAQAAQQREQTRQNEQNERADADYMARQRDLEQKMRELEAANRERTQQRKEAEQKTKDDNDLSRVAGQLLDSVSHDNSQKFQESQFLGLMRKLRDKKMAVDAEGENFVETTTPSTNLDTTATTTTQRTASTSLPANDPYTFEATFDYRPTATTSHSEGRAAHEGSDADLGRFGVTYSVPQDVGSPTPIHHPPPRPLTPEIDPPAPTLAQWRRRYAFASNNEIYHEIPNPDLAL